MLISAAEVPGAVMLLKRIAEGFVEQRAAEAEGFMSGIEGAHVGIDGVAIEEGEDEGCHDASETDGEDAEHLVGRKLTGYIAQKLGGVVGRDGAGFTAFFPPDGVEMN